MRFGVQILVVATFVAGGFVAPADETDQFMTWGVNLRDSAEQTNTHINNLLREAIDYRNGALEPPCDCQSLAFDAIDYMFKGRLTSRIMPVLESDESIDAYPPRSISRTRYQRSSIYRGLSFPFILPMGRTVRIGDVYFGEDKWGHFFGMGKRYYRHYLWYRENGMSEDDAIDMTINWGVFTENTLVGMVVDGIFSHADLEANYQGFELARHMCEGEAPYIGHGVDGWELVREIDLRDYITPYWDESYNPSHYWGRRRILVMPILRDEYASKAQSPEVIARFRAYQNYPPSRSVEYIRHYFVEREQFPQRDQTFTALGLGPDYPSAILAAMPVP